MCVEYSVCVICIVYMCMVCVVYIVCMCMLYVCDLHVVYDVYDVCGVHSVCM